MALFFDKKFEEAVEALTITLQEVPTHAAAHRFLAASYAHVGRMQEANDVLQRLRKFAPGGVRTDGRVFRNPEHRELLLSGLRLAMGEAG